MSDLVNRQQAIDVLEEQLDYLFMLNKEDNPTAESKWYGINWARNAIAELPTIDLVRCKECKHRPIKYDPDGADYGFNIVEPTDDGDHICPCLVEDGWYSWMPEDNFYCGRGERKPDEKHR